MPDDFYKFSHFPNEDTFVTLMGFAVCQQMSAYVFVQKYSNFEGLASPTYR